VITVTPEPNAFHRRRKPPLALAGERKAAALRRSSFLDAPDGAEHLKNNSAIGAIRTGGRRRSGRAIIPTRWPCQLL